MRAILSIVLVLYCAPAMATLEGIPSLWFVKIIKAGGYERGHPTTVFMSIHTTQQPSFLTIVCEKAAKKPIYTE
jgi:hypothetical protein